jgi:hypothetical protein
VPILEAVDAAAIEDENAAAVACHFWREI